MPLCLKGIYLLKVSILIACYNSKQWIGQAIESALTQTWQDKEVLVYDDGSTDGSQEVIREFGSKIQADMGTNRGASAARNQLISQATGDWIQILDGDDYLLPDKIERQLQWLTDHSSESGADIVFSPTYYEHVVDGQVIPRAKSTLNQPHDPWILLVKNQLPQTGGPLWRRSSLQSVGAYDTEDPFGLEDLVYLKLLAAGKRAAFCPEIGAVYRLWGSHTLGQKNPREYCLTRLQIIDDAERYLDATNQLDPSRRDAIAYGRLDCARTVYPFDRRLAIATALALRTQHPLFAVPAGEHFPLSYRILYRLLGFAGTERLATLLRRLRGRSGTES